MTTNLCQMLRLRLSGALRLLPICAIMACVGHLGFYLCIIEWTKCCYYWTVEFFCGTFVFLTFWTLFNAPYFK